MTTGVAVIAHGGGPTSVINASLAGVVEQARRVGIPSLLGARGGIAGVIDDNFIDLYAQPPERVEAVASAPSSALGTSRVSVAPAGYERILDTFRRRGVRWFFYNGGNGSMYLASQVARAAAAAGYELRVIGIPKTIDNDIAGTDHTPGYASCARFFAHAVRDIGADIRALPGRVTFVETLGRNAGWIVAATALARQREDDAPHLIYLPERPVSADTICGDAERVYRRLGYAVVAVCEGLTNERGEPFGADMLPRDGFGRQLAGNLAHTLSRIVGGRTGLKTRSEKPGLFGRSSAGYVSGIDRAEARMCGRAAVAAAAAGESGRMVTLVREPGGDYRCTTGLAPLDEAAFAERLFPAEWIAGAGVEPAFIEWARPLIGTVEPLARFD